MVTKDLKRLFPAMVSLPDAVSSERAFLFWHKVRLGEVRREQLYSPVAYMTKMADEDIAAILAKWREARSRGG
jgi:hypothetical protein